MVKAWLKHVEPRGFHAPKPEAKTWRHQQLFGVARRKAIANPVLEIQAPRQRGKKAERELVEKHDLKSAYSLEYNRIFCGIKCGIQWDLM